MLDHSGIECRVDWTRTRSSHGQSGEVSLGKKSIRSVAPKKKKEREN